MMQQCYPERQNQARPAPCCYHARRGLGSHPRWRGSRRTPAGCSACRAAACPAPGEQGRLHCSVARPPMGHGYGFRLQPLRVRGQPSQAGHAAAAAVSSQQPRAVDISSQQSSSAYHDHDRDHLAALGQHLQNRWVRRLVASAQIGHLLLCVPQCMSTCKGGSTSRVNSVPRQRPHDGLSKRSCRACAG